MIRYHNVHVIYKRVYYWYFVINKFIIRILCKPNSLKRHIPEFTSAVDTEQVTIVLLVLCNIALWTRKLVVCTIMKNSFSGHINLPRAGDEDMRVYEDLQ
jgi:hypothetical protein